MHDEVGAAGRLEMRIKIVNYVILRRTETTAVFRLRSSFGYACGFLRSTYTREWIFVTVDILSQLPMSTFLDKTFFEFSGELLIYYSELSLDKLLRLIRIVDTTHSTLDKNFGGSWNNRRKCTSSNTFHSLSTKTSTIS